jgi:hypothetical protein
MVCWNAASSITARRIAHVLQAARTVADIIHMADMPAWLAPPLEAAREERTEALALVGAGAPAATGLDLVNAAVDAALDAWLAKRGRSCAHLDEPDTPAYLAFGNPRVLCSMCLDFYQAGVTGTPDDRRCDLCGEHIETPTLGPLVVEVGPISLMGGACSECRDTDS